tara:strand:- start:2969 stop:3184 length:216 start_codon:yes stop_codon:yes gene_type:complete
MSRPTLTEIKALARTYLNDFTAMDTSQAWFRFHEDWSLKIYDDWASGQRKIDLYANIKNQEVLMGELDLSE